MGFFHLDWPEYKSDSEMEANNCCFTDPNEFLLVPGVKCPYCGTTWATLGERLVVTDIALSSWLREQLTKHRPVAFEEYENIVQRLRIELNLSPSTKILPGTEVDLLAVRCECAGHIQDFMWNVGSLLVSQRVVDTLSTAKLTGYQVYPVHITNAEEISAELPTLYRFIVVGRGGPMGPESELSLESECNKCGRRNYQDVYWGFHGPKKFQGLYVNPETWDGSDFFTFDDWPTIIIITEKARSVLASAGLSNWQAYPLPLGAIRW